MNIKKWNWFVLMIILGAMGFGIKIGHSFNFNQQVLDFLSMLSVLVIIVGNLLLRNEFEKTK